MIILSVALSEACNLNCSYCNVNKNSKDKINPDFFITEYYKLRRKNKNELIQIDFYGGEPLLQFESIKYIIEKLKDEENIQYFMPTNGLLLNEEKLIFFNKNNVKISLSYDGLWHHQNRPQKNNQNTLFEKNKEFLKSLKNVRIHSMIYNNNFNLLENHLFILNEFGVNPDLTIVRDNIWTEGSVRELKKSITELFEFYINDTTNELPNFIHHFLHHVLIFKSKKIKKQYCGAGDTHLSFSENKLVPCNRFKNDEESILKIPSFINMKECSNCEVKDVCEKGCLYENIKNDGPITGVCDLYRHIYKEIEKMFITLNNDENFKSLIRKEINKEYGIK